MQIFQRNVLEVENFLLPIALATITTAICHILKVEKTGEKYLALQTSYGKSVSEAFRFGQTEAQVRDLSFLSFCRYFVSIDGGSDSADSVHSADSVGFRRGIVFNAG